MKKFYAVAFLLAGFTLISFSGFAQNIPSYVPTNGLVGWWPFNGNANDESGNGNDGLVKAAEPSYDRFGNANQAYAFRYPNDIITTQPFYDFTKDFSVSFWTYSTSTKHQTVFNTIPHTIVGYALNPVWSGPNTIGFLFGTGADAGWLNPYYYFQSPVPLLNNWVHHTIVKNGNTWSFYINGSLGHTYTATASPAATVSALVFGNCDPSVTTSPLIGTLDDIAMFNRAITSPEVRAVYKPSDLNGPISLDLSGNTVTEGLSAGTEIGRLSATGNSSGPYVFTLVQGTGDSGNSAFTISDNRLKSASVFDSRIKADYSVRIRVTDQQGQGIEKSFNIQVFPKEPFITVWKTDLPGLSPANQLLFPGTGNNYLIEWENVSVPGQKGSLTGNGYTQITFPETGTYRLKVSGNFNRMEYYNCFSPNDAKKLIRVEQWGTTQWTSFENMFCGANNNQVTAKDIPDLRLVTSTAQMFRDNILFDADINNWDVSRVTDMTGMFINTAFNHPLNKWNVGNVTVMDNMFWVAPFFNQDISSWNVSKVKSMSYMFASADRFNQPIGSWDVSSVENMNRMFNLAGSFNQPLGHWNVSNVKDMQAMLANAVVFNQDISKWDVSNVTNMSSMFSRAHAFNSDISGWNVSRVKNMAAMFDVTDAFNQPIGNWDVSGVMDMTGMFYRASKFNQDISGWCVEKITAEPAAFAEYAILNQNFKPAWGTCPITVSLSNNTISDASVSGQVVGTFSSPKSPRGPFTYSLPATFGDNSQFALSGNNLIASGAFNHREKSIYAIRLTVTDSTGVSIGKDFSIYVLPAYLPVNGLLGWWPFNGNAKDESGNGYDGVVNGATITMDRFNRTASAYAFNGINNSISVGDIDFQSVTASAWVYPLVDASGPSNFSLSLVDKNRDAISSNGFGMYYNNQAGYGLYSQVGISSDPATTIFSKALLSLQQWHHCLVVYDSGKASLYLDGVLVASKSGMPPISQNNESVLFGRALWGGNLFSGKLDDIALWNRKLTATEIHELFKADAKPQTISLSPLPAKTYGNAPFMLNASTSSGLPVTYSSSNPLVAVIEGDSVTITGAGTTTISAIQKGDFNWLNADTVTQLLTVNKAIVAVQAENKSKIYGDVNPPFTLTYSGLVNNETISVIDSPPSATTTAVSTSNVGTYQITAAGGTDNNYTFSYTAGTLTINKATLNATADNKSRRYGDANPSFTLTYSGFKNSETASVIDTPPTASTTSTISSAVGTYPITVSGGSDNNYTFTYVSGTLTVNKAALTAKADDLSRPYNTDNPALTLSYSGFKNNETSSVIDAAPVAATTAVKTSLPGTYPITVSGGTDNNYSFSYQSGTLTVTKLAQTVTFTLTATLFQDESPYTLTATSTSGGPIVFSVSEGNATVSGNLLTITGAGTLKITASQAGTELYATAQTTATTTVGNSYLVSGLITKPVNVPLPTGIAKLFYEAGGLAKNGTVLNGNYSIALVRPGRYIMQVVPTGNDEDKVFPAYYNGALLNKDATVIVVEGNTTINMEMPAKPSNDPKGQGEIKGKVTGGNGGGRFIVGRIADGVGLPNVPVYLLDNTDKVLKTVNTDKDGLFTFTELVTGTYKLALDVVGATLAASSTTVEVDPAKGVLEVSAAVSTVNNKPVITLGVQVITGLEGNDITWWLYPNPAREEIRIGWRSASSSTINLTLSDLNGKQMQVQSQEPDSVNTEIVMPISDLSLPGGLYLLQVNQGAVRKTVKVVVR